MKVQVIGIFAAIAGLTSTVAGSAQEADPAPSDDIIMNAWSNPSDCNRDNALRIKFTTLAKDFHAIRGECVVVEGYWYGRALFGSPKQANFNRAFTSHRLSGKRVGLYAQWENIGEPPAEPSKTEFVGRVGECETQWPGAMMVMGYCHYTGGPILLVSEILPREGATGS